MLRARFDIFKPSNSRICIFFFSISTTKKICKVCVRIGMYVCMYIYVCICICRYVLQSSVTDEVGCSQLRGFPSMRTVGVPNPLRVIRASTVEDQRKAD